MKNTIATFGLLLILAGAAGCAPATTMPQFITESAPQVTQPPADVSPTAEAITSSQVDATSVCRPFQSTATKIDWVQGNPQAPITIIEYSDFQCPYCAQFSKVVTELVKQYPDQIQVVFRHFPLSFHPYAPITARAAEAAGIQGKFWEYQEILFANQNSWSNLDEQGVQAFLEDSAETLGLDVDQFKSDLESQPVNEKVVSQTDFGTAEGVTGTPFVIVNGMHYQGTDLPGMQQLIESLKTDPKSYSECPPAVLDPNKSYSAVIETRTGEVTIRLANQESPVSANAFAYMSQNDWYKNQTFFQLVRDDATQQLRFLLGGNQINQGWFTLSREGSTLQFDQPGVVGIINGSQFFVAMEATPELNGQYTVVGQVTQGLDLLADMQSEGEPIRNIRIIEE